MNQQNTKQPKLSTRALYLLAATMAVICAGALAFIKYKHNTVSCVPDPCESLDRLLSATQWVADISLLLAVTTAIVVAYRTLRKC
jgi:hypothetical protein